MPIIDTDARPPFGDTEIDHIGILTQALFFERLQKANIETAAGTLLLPSSLCSAPMTDDLLRRVNDAARTLADTHPDRYIPGIHVTPELPALSCAEIERYAAEGVSILGEIQSGWLDDPQYDQPLSEIFACAAQYRMTVSIHPAAAKTTTLTACTVAHSPRLNVRSQCAKRTHAAASSIPMAYTSRNAGI